MVKYGKAISIKEELLVFMAAINPITVIINMPCNLISLMPIYIRTNSIIRYHANMPMTRTIN